MSMKPFASLEKIARSAYRSPLVAAMAAAVWMPGAAHAHQGHGYEMDLKRPLFDFIMMIGVMIIGWCWYRRWGIPVAPEGGRKVRFLAAKLVLGVVIAASGATLKFTHIPPEGPCIPDYVHSHR